MRVLRFTAVALAIAMLPSSTPAQPITTPLDSVSSVLSKRNTVPIAPERTVSADTLGHQAPAPSDRPIVPIEVVGLGVALATAKKGSRRAAGKRSDVAMILDSHVDVMREDKKGNLVSTRITGGQLVDDTDLEDDEIDELTARKVIRPAKPEELERLEKGDVAQERESLVREQEEAMAKLRAQHEQATAELGDDASAAKRTALEKRQATELEKLQTAHTKALNKLDT